MISASARIADNSVIEPGVIIGARVSIGPFCFISAGVEIGEGTTIASHTVINGLTRIGRDNVIGQFSSIGEASQDLKYAGEPTTLTIGDRNRIGKYAPCIAVRCKAANAPSSVMTTTCATMCMLPMTASSVTALTLAITAAWRVMLN